MRRLLIVNADDCNLTPGVTQAILDCHDYGILSSTTLMINLPTEKSTVDAVKKRKNLGVGIHLNITLARPVSKPSRVKSLLGPVGQFRKVGEQLTRLPKAAELLQEYQEQIDLFRKILGRKPTHLDTHHQIHDHPFFMKVFLEVARMNKLPVRRSALTMSSPEYSKVKTPAFFFGNLSAAHHWTRGPLENLLKHLPSGVSEIMCHPGKIDSDLRAITSFIEGRKVEYDLFRDPAFRRLLAQSGIQLAHYGLCYN